MLLAQHYNNLKQKKKKKQRISHSRASLGSASGMHRSFSEDSGLEDLYAGYSGSADNLSDCIGPCDQSDDDFDSLFEPAHLMLDEMLDNIEKDPDHEQADGGRYDEVFQESEDASDSSISAATISRQSSCVSYATSRQSSSVSGAADFLECEVDCGGLVSLRSE